MNYFQIPFLQSLIEKNVQTKIYDHFPYLAHWSKNMILCKDNSLISFIKLQGYAFETGNDEDLDIKKTLRNNLFKSLNGENIYLHFYIVNSKVKHKSNNTYEKLSFSAYLDKKWQLKQTNKSQYQKEIYLGIKYHFSENYTLIEKIKNIFENNIYQQILEGSKSLNDIIKRISQSLKDYIPRTLKSFKKNDNYYCEMTSFLKKLVNISAQGKSIMPMNNINQNLGESRVTFKQKHIVHSNTQTPKYTSIIAINKHPSTTSSSILDSILYLKFEFILHQTFSFTRQADTLDKIEKHQKQMIQTQDKSVSQIYEISEALDMATSGKIGFGYHSLQLLCIADNQKALEEFTAMGFTELINNGITPVRENINMELSFFSLLPGNEEYIMRKTLISTLNLAGYASFHNFPIGNKTGNHWGEYTSLLETTADTPYYFSFHARSSDVGHTLIIGPTGSGKTVIMNFLSAQLQKFKPKMFFFDKDHGAEIFIRSINGVYNTIQIDCGFNPLQLFENKVNKAFLIEWLSVLVTPNNEILSSEDKQLIHQAIEGNFKLKKQDRKLSNIAPFLGMPKDNNIASRLLLWYGSGAKSSIFDNTKDTINFSSARIFGFEMSNILQDKTALSPVLLYIFHRIQISLDGYPTTIVLDEAWALIDNPLFRNKIKDWLKVLRKLNTFVIFATQSVEDATQSSISHTLIQQTSTQIFLPNLKATEAYQKVFMLTNREYSLIKTTDPQTRFFLIKQNKESIIARIDLSGMPDIISVLSGKSKTTNILKKLIAKYGSDVEKWLPAFHQHTSKN